MITFKPIIIPNNRRKDGTYPVKIRVTFKGVVRRLPTTLVCTSADLTRSLKIKNATILDKADELIRQMRSAVSDVSPFDLEERDVDWVVQHIKDRLRGESFALDFFEWGEHYIETKTPKTRMTYSCALNTFERFLGERRIDINDISRSLLMEFVEYVDNEPKIRYNARTGEFEHTAKEKLSQGASSRHLMKLQHIFNAAKDRYNDEDCGRILIPRSPFDSIKKNYPVTQGHRTIGADVMQKVISYQTDNPLMRTALDLFILSFCLMGANMADLYNATSFDGEFWTYHRQKTTTRRADKAMMKVRIPAVVRPYLDRLEGSGVWWLNRLHEFASSKDFATIRVNRLLTEWAHENGVERFTFYSARHEWASEARNRAKIEKALVDECLSHIGDFNVADIYIEKDFSLMDEANEKVLSLFDFTL